MNCSVAECADPVRAKGMCSRHYQRFRAGKPIERIPRGVQGPDDFWKFIQKSEGCWLWTRYKNKRGYGRLRFKGKNEYAHRLAWVFTNGPIPQGKDILHSCDNPPCCRPDHLGPGTKKKNMEEASERDRMGTRANGRWNGGTGESHWTKKHPNLRFRGEANPFSKLTDEQVMEIRRKYSNKEANQYQLASLYRVHQRTISRIVRKEEWKHL